MQNGERILLAEPSRSILLLEEPVGRSGLVTGSALVPTPAQAPCVSVLVSPADVW